MTTIHDPIDVTAGRNWEFGGPLVDLDDNPLNLSGAAIVWKLDTVDGFTNVLELELSSSGGISVTNLALAEILVNATAEDTGPVAAGTYRDWLTVTLADGSVLDMWSGIIRVARAPA